MPPAKNENTPIEIDLDVFEVNAIGDKKFQPFFNVFHFQGANYAEQKLGELFGVIQIFDDSKNSAYLPNVIAQVIKKEFFSDYRRPTEKAFESALHKANLALTDLAQHEIVEWMGRLHSVIGVLNKESFHFTQAGGGRILLIRNKLVSDITRGLDDGEGVGHPIKTFSNISAGNVSTDDKLIFCTETVFESFSWEDLKRHCNAFSSAEFDNLFRATLMSEAQQAGAIVINVNEKATQPVPSFKPNVVENDTIPDQNFFGSAADSKRNPESLLAPPHHQASPPSTTPSTQQSTAASQNATATTSSLQAQSTLRQEANQEEYDNQDNINLKHDRNDVIYIREAEEKPAETAESTDRIKQRLAVFFLAVKTAWKEHWPDIRKKIIKNSKKSWLLIKKTAAILLESFRRLVRSLFNKYQARRMYRESIRQKEITSSANIQNNSMHPAKPDKPNHIQTISALWEQSLKLRPKYLLAAAGLLVTVIVVYVIFSRPAPSNEEVTNHPDSLPSSSIPSANADSSSMDNPLLEIHSLAAIGTPVIQIAGMKNDLFILAQEDSFFRFNLTDNKLSKIDLPIDMRQIKTIARMNDLNLVFLISPTAVYSYSPVTNKFQTNNIELPTDLDIAKADCYMTYLYLLDKKTNQIFQYPRAQGGFGQKKDWLKKTLDDSSVTDMSIDGSIYISFSNGQVKKYFQWKEDPTFSFTGSAAIQPSHLVADRENEPAYLLDNRQSKLMEMSPAGAVTKEWHDARLEQAKDFWVEYDKKTAYFIDSNNNLLSFELL